MVVGSTQDPPGHDVEEDDELEMIRSMLRAEEDKDLEGRKNAHSKIISKLGASTSSLFTLSPVNEAVYDNDHLFDGAADDQQAGADPTNGTPQGADSDSSPTAVQESAGDDRQSAAATNSDAADMPPPAPQDPQDSNRSRSDTLTNDNSAPKAHPGLVRSMSSAQHSVSMSSVGSGVSESATSYQQQQQTNNAQQQYPSRLPGVRKRVSQLLRHRRQREPLIVEEDTTIRQVCEQMASTRNSAFLMVTLVNGVKRVSGIGTDVDVCKSVSHDLDPETTKVSEIMTPWPKSVEPSDEAQIAFKMMVGNRFRHLPVIKRDGSCAGLIDIAQCLYDGIAQLESIQRAQASFMDAVKQTRLRWLQDQSETNQDGNVAHHMISTMMNDAAHDVRSLISTGAPLLCPDTASVREAASRMYTARKTAILVFSEEAVTDDNNDDVGEVEAAGGVTSSGKVCGILTTKDILSRVVAKGLDANATVVSTVMTPEPDTIPLECSLIDALHVMLDGRYLHIPVEDKGKVCGVLDVLDCAVAMFGPSLKNKRAHTSNAAAALNDPQQGGGDGGDMTEFADLLFDTAPHSSSASAAGAHDADSLSQYSGAGAFTAQQQQLYPVTRGRRDSASVSSSRQQQQKQQQRGRGPSAQGRRMMIADGSALVVGQEGEDQVDESDLYGSGDDVQIVIKVRDMTRGGKLSRVHCDMFDYDSAVLAVLGAPGDDESETHDAHMWYLDDDGDEITLDSHEAFSAACHLYQTQKWSKLEVVVRDTSNPSANGGQSGSNGGVSGIGGFVSDVVGSLFGSNRTAADNVIVAGAVLVALSAALAVSSLVMYSDTAGSGHGPSYHRSGRRRY